MMMFLLGVERLFCSIPVFAHLMGVESNKTRIEKRRTLKKFVNHYRHTKAFFFPIRITLKISPSEVLMKF